MTTEDAEETETPYGMPYAPPTNHDSKRALWTIVGACALSVVAVLGALAIFVDQSQQDDQELAAKLEQARLDRGVEACEQENASTQRVRYFKHEQVLFFAENFFNRTPEQVQALIDSEELEVYDDFVAETFPFRDCSYKCVEAYYDEGIPDCTAPDRPTSPPN